MRLPPLVVAALLVAAAASVAAASAQVVLSASAYPRVVYVGQQVELRVAVSAVSSVSHVSVKLTVRAPSGLILDSAVKLNGWGRCSVSSSGALATCSVDLYNLTAGETVDLALFTLAATRPGSYSVPIDYTISTLPWLGESGTITVRLKVIPPTPTLVVAVRPSYVELPSYLLNESTKPTVTLRVGYYLTSPPGYRCTVRRLLIDISVPTTLKLVSATVSPAFESNLSATQLAQEMKLVAENLTASSGDAAVLIVQPTLIGRFPVQAYYEYTLLCTVTGQAKGVLRLHGSGQANSTISVVHAAKPSKGESKISEVEDALKVIGLGLLLTLIVPPLGIILLLIGGLALIGALVS